MKRKLAPRVAYFATQGAGHGDELRMRELLADLDPELLSFDRGARGRSSLGLLRQILRRRPDLVVMEGTGVGGGLAVIAARRLAGIPYVVSSGDAVGPYIRLDHPRAAPLAGLYERLLCRWSAGFIGWSPYLVGRALTFGAPRGMTAAGWSQDAEGLDREARRRDLGIPADAVVFGLVGSLRWNDSVGYCYGLELVRAALAAERDDLRVLIVGDGSGLPHLQELAERSEGRVILTGRVPKDEVGSYLGALDVASLPQSVDGVGSFRYTTKISEYLGAGLPIVTGEIPLAYDLDDGWLWRLPGAAPWSPLYLDALADLMRTVTDEDLAAHRSAAPRNTPTFDRTRQRRLVGEFVADLLTQI